MILRDYECAAHGTFESDEPVCPAGCKGRFVTVVFLQPPAYHDGRSSHRDRTLRELADSVGLTNLKLDKEDVGNGRSVMDNLRRPQGPEDFKPFAAEVPHAPAGWSQRGEKPLTVNPTSTFGVQGDNIGQRLKEAGVPFRGPTIEASKAAKLFTADPNPRQTRGEA